MRITDMGTGLYKLEVPFEDIYTSVFPVSDGKRYVLVDAATTDGDVDGVILPLLRSVGFSGAPEALLLSHPHGDHAGGARRLTEIFGGLPVYSPAQKKGIDTLPLSEGDTFLGRLTVLSLPGHTESSCGFYDMETKTLISCDCLQLRGVSRYTNGIRYPELYRASVERLQGMEIDRILASHEYVPLGSVAEGREAVRRYLTECLRSL